MNIETMRLLVAKGLSAEEILEVAETMAVRSSGAERQARYRARQRGDDVTRDVTRDSNASDNTPPYPRPLSPQTPLTPTPIPPEITTRARKGHRLPVDWQAKPLPAELSAQVAQWPPGEIERELARFRDWAASATGPNALKSDWDAAWRNWLRRKIDERPTDAKRNSNNRGGSTASAASLAMQRLGYT